MADTVQLDREKAAEIKRMLVTLGLRIGEHGGITGKAFGLADHLTELLETKRFDTHLGDLDLPCGRGVCCMGEGHPGLCQQ